MNNELKGIVATFGCLLLGLGLAAPRASAQFSLTNSFYSQNFDSMGSSGTTAPTGWFVGSLSPQATNGTVTSRPIVVSDGSGTSANNYNFGTTGDSDRALGSKAESGGTRVTEFRFTNNTGLTLTDLTLSYTGEQWRRATTTNALTLHYGTNENALADAPSSFTFTTPILGTATSLDGNATANRVTSLGGTISGLSIPNGTTFILRWIDLDDTDTVDAGIALDDFSLTVAIPEPSTIILVGFGLLFTLAKFRRQGAVQGY